MDCELPPGRDLGPLFVISDFTTLFRKNKNKVSIGSQRKKKKNGVNELCALFLCINRDFLAVVSKKKYGNMTVFVQYIQVCSCAMSFFVQ